MLNDNGNKDNSEMIIQQARTNNSNALNNIKYVSDPPNAQCCPRTNRSTYIKQKTMDLVPMTQSWRAKAKVVPLEVKKGPPGKEPIYKIGGDPNAQNIAYKHI